GIKVTGKTNGYTVGAIASTDTRTGFLIPSSLGSYLEVLEDQNTEQDISSDVFIVRGQNDFGEQNNVGVILTHRSATDYKNDVVAIDGRYYFTKKDILSYQLMYSDSENPDYIRFDGEDDPNTTQDEREELFAASQSDTAYTLSYRHNEENYSFRANYNNFGKDFRADLGFIGQVDYEKLIIGGDYFWYGKEGSKWTRWGFFGDWDITKDQSGKKLEEESEIHFSIRGPLQFQTNFGVVDRERFYDEQYFDEQSFMMWFQFKPWSNFTFGNFMRIGDQIDFTHSQLGDMKLFEPYIRWEIGKHFNVRVSITSQSLDVDGGELFNASVADVRMAYQFSNRSRLSLTLQSFDIERNTALYESNQDNDDENDVYSLSKRFGTQLIYSYKINPQSLVYLGYSDSARENDDIQSLTKDDKTVFAKVSYMWQH
ncbi:MAG: hypothetical protein OQK04_12035, partial [Kangiellaceae bacterium]|nr:hypothetical protein [Kangiellaceae bacterium]